MLSDTHQAVFVAAIQVAAMNAARGLLFSEREDNPEVGALVVQIDMDGAVDVTLLSKALHPIGGYSL